MFYCAFVLISGYMIMLSCLSKEPPGHTWIIHKTPELT